MNSDDISSTNVDIDVTGMLRIAFILVGHFTAPSTAGSQTSCGYGPLTLRPLEVRYVEMSGAKSMHYDPMIAQMAITQRSRPVLVAGCAWVATAVAIVERILWSKFYE